MRLWFIAVARIQQSRSVGEWLFQLRNRDGFYDWFPRTRSWVLWPR